MTDDSRSRVLLNYRLAPDMLPFVLQIQVGEVQLPDIRYGVTVANPHRLRIGGISVAFRRLEATTPFRSSLGTAELVKSFD